MEILKPDDAGIAAAAARLRAGEIVAVPTETVYGLAANALDVAAVRLIFEAKGRPFIDPLIVHVADRSGIEALAEPHPLLDRLLGRFMPGPLTVILRKRACVPDLVTAGEPTVAVRLPAHPVMQRLLRASGLPLAAPSANPFGYVSPTTAVHVVDSLAGRVPCVIDGGPCAHGVESTIVSLVDPAGPCVLRPGPIAIADLEACLGVPVRRAPSHLDSRKAQLAPGMLESHYSPRTPMVLWTGIEPGPAPAGAGRSALVFLKRPDAARLASPGEEIFWFSESGSPEEVARNLFALVRHLDAAGFSLLRVQAPAPGGLADAILDRLHRAAAKRDVG